MAISEGQLIFRQLTIALLNASGIFGLLLIGYGWAIDFNSKWSWPLLDTYAQFISTILTLLGTFFTAASVYFPVHSRRADTHSRKVLAPLVCLLTLVSIYFLFFGNKPIPQNVINGFAVLGLTGALFRLLPWSEEPGLKN